MELIHIPTGTVIHKIDDGAGKALLLLAPEAFKRTEPKPAPAFNVQPPSNPAAPRWLVRNHPLSGTPELVRAALNQEQRYPGPGIEPTLEGAKAAFGAAGHFIPTDALDKFAALLEIARANNPDVVNEARLRAQDKQYVREANERGAQRKLAGE